MTVLCTLSVARSDDRMSQLAERITTPGEAEVNTPESAGPSLEDRPLGRASDPADQMLTRPDSVEADGSWVMQTLTSLGLVIGLVLIGRWVWGRFNGHVTPKSSPIVEVLSRTAIAPRNHVLLLRVGARVLVVSDSSGGTRTLANIDEPQEVADLIASVSTAQNQSISKSFTRLLQGYNGEYDEHQAAREEGHDDGEYHLDHARESVSSLLSRVRFMRKRGGKP